MIDKLELFLALAKHQHFGKAAEDCGITQPTLSSAIKQLEEQLGVVLVQRGSRFQGLTEEGQRVLELSRRIVNDTRSMREEMKAVRHGLTGTLKIGIIPTASALIYDLTSQFIADHGRVQLDVTVSTSLEIMAKLNNFEIDVGISYLHNEPLSARTVTLPLYSERLQYIVREGGPLSDRDHITWSDLEDIPLCLLPQTMQNRRIIDTHAEAAGVEIKPKLESNSMIVLLSHIMNQDWGGIMPVNMASLMGFGDNLKSMPIQGPAATNLVGLIAAKREPHTPLVAALLNKANKMALQNRIV